MNRRAYLASLAVLTAGAGCVAKRNVTSKSRTDDTESPAIIVVNETETQITVPLTLKRSKDGATILDTTFELPAGADKQFSVSTIESGKYHIKVGMTGAPVEPIGVYTWNVQQSQTASLLMVTLTASGISFDERTK